MDDELLFRLKSRDGGNDGCDLRSGDFKLLEDGVELKRDFSCKGDGDINCLSSKLNMPALVTSP